MVIRVQTRDNEPVDKALRRLRKLCNNEGLTRKSKAKAFFEKPSEKRRRERRERAKSIRLASRAKRQDVEKLLQRRRKARKNARSAARAAAAEEAAETQAGGVAPDSAPADKGEGAKPATAAPTTQPAGEANKPAAEAKRPTASAAPAEGKSSS